MGTIHVRELTGGLDTRRLPETTPGGVLVVGDDGHITRGGDFETRPSFVYHTQLAPEYVGMETTSAGTKYFTDTSVEGTDAPYLTQEILNTSGQQIHKIISHAEFNGKSYVSALLRNGVMAHYYGGVQDTTWVEARARTSVRFTDPIVNPGAQATATLDVLTVTGVPGEYIDFVNAGDTTITNGRFRTRSTPEETAQALADAINSNDTSPLFEAEVIAPGNRVLITAKAGGAANNGQLLSWDVTGPVTLGNATVFAGGVNSASPRITSIILTKGGASQQLLVTPIDWPGDMETLREEVAAAINDRASRVDFEAFIIGQDVFVRAPTAGTDNNGYVLSVLATNITVSYPTGSSMAGGAALAAGTYLPADTLLTVRDKLYAGSGTILHFSAIGQPTVWAPPVNSGDPVGAGFVNIGASNSTSTKITGLARYYDKLAVFTEDTVQTWFIDPDPDLFQQVQVLENTGTRFPKSVAQFGDTDIFYLDHSGLRSLRARDSSNAASTTDIGSPLDDILVEKIRRMRVATNESVKGLINEDDTRFWLVFKDEIFVYSYYPHSKVNAWTRYRPTGYDPVAEEVVTFRIIDVSAARGRVFLRDADGRVWVLGGIHREKVYDEHLSAEAWLPYLDANAPSATKEWTGVDAALRGEWELRVSYDPREPQASDHIANLTETTYGERRVPMKHKSVFASLRFKSRGGYGKLASAILHFTGKISDE